MMGMIALLWLVVQGEELKVSESAEPPARFEVRGKPLRNVMGRYETKEEAREAALRMQRHSPNLKLGEGW